MYCTVEQVLYNRTVLIVAVWRRYRSSIAATATTVMYINEMYTSLY